MSRRAFLLALLAPFLGRAETPITAETLAAFHIPYDKFFRTFFGCPPYVQDPRACNSTHGLIDIKLLKEVRKRASIWLE